jgi:hypothetical protein
MAHEGILDLDLLGRGEGAANRSSIHEDPVVDEEGRRTLPRPLAAVRAEDFDLHSTP